MSGTDDLKDLLDRLKAEVGPLPPERPQPLAAAPRAPERSEAPRPRPERFARPIGSYGARAAESQQQSSRELSWRENKEIILFGMLSSLIAALGGVLAGLDYLVLTGAVIFALFSLILLLSLFGQLRSSAGLETEPGLQERVDALSRKIEALSLRASPDQGAGHAGGDAGRELELERKVEELRVLFKSLAKAVEQRK